MEPDILRQVVTVPLAVLLTYLYRPIRARGEVSATGGLLLISAACATLWESYLVRAGLWVHTPDTPLQLALQKTAFCVRLYTSFLVFKLANKTTIHAVYLCDAPNTLNARSRGKWRYARRTARSVLFLLGVLYGVRLVRRGGHTTYLGLIIVTMGVPLLLLRNLSSSFTRSLPYRVVYPPILLIAIYQWIFMRPYLISESAKLRIRLFYWMGPEFESVAFVLLTSLLIVWGLATFSYADALIQAFPAVFPSAPPSPSLFLRAKALFQTYPIRNHRYAGLVEAGHLLDQTSNSLYLGACLIDGRLQLDLIGLYAFCRAACDLMEGAPNTEKARIILQKLHQYADLIYSAKDPLELDDFLAVHFSDHFHAPLMSYPREILPRHLLEDLLASFALDTRFPAVVPTMEGPVVTVTTREPWPVQTPDDLYSYTALLSGTMGEMVFRLVHHHHPHIPADLLPAAQTLCQALHLVGLARDLEKHVARGRIYVPAPWVQATGLKTAALVDLWNYNGVYEGDLGGDGHFIDKMDQIKCRLLLVSEKFWGNGCGDVVGRLPEDVRKGFRIALEGYWDVGRFMMDGKEKRTWWKRLRWAWRIAKDTETGTCAEKRKDA